MPAVKHKDTILNVIDQLRNRKARPDLDHISHMVQRRYGLNRAETESILERLVELDIVIKVEYKGSTSYRNAAKWKKSGIGGNVLNSNETSVYIQRAIDEINASKFEQTEQTDDESPPSNEGASLADIQTWVEANVDNSAWLKKNSGNADNLSTALEREVDSGRIRKLSNKRYVLVTTAENKGSPALTVKERLNSSGAESANSTPAKSQTTPAGKVTKKGRPPGTLNRKKKLSTNASNNTTTSKTKRENATPEPTPDEPKMEVEETPPGDYVVVKCRLCYLPMESNRDGQPEAMLTCKECNNTVHPSCMNYSSDLAERALRSPWQCNECKTCCLCSEAGEAAELLFCDSCDKGYHMQCHKPKVLENPTGIWECSSCILEQQQNGNETSDKDDEMDACNTEGGGPSCLPTPCESPVSFDDDLNANDKFSEKKFMESVVKKIDLDGRLADKDATDWTIDDVAEFITRAGFPDQATRFNDQEIDGKSLLLMQRNDVLTGLSMKLGPALKIYSHIHKLQTTCSENV